MGRSESPAINAAKANRRRNKTHKYIRNTIAKSHYWSSGSKFYIETHFDSEPLNKTQMITQKALFISAALVFKCQIF